VLWPPGFQLLLFVILPQCLRTVFVATVRGASGLLAVVALGSTSVHAQAVTSFDVFQTQFYSQTTTAQPTTPGSYAFNARIFVSGTVSSPTATLSWPTAQSGGMTQSGNVFQRGQGFGSASAMDTAFPTGNYDFSLSSASLSPTTQTGTLVMPASFYALSVPYFTNFTTLQALTAADTATFSWNSFSTNSSAQLSQIFLVIKDTTTNTQVLNQFISNAATTSYSLTSGALVAGDHYTATLYFSSRDAYPSAWSGGAGGLVAFDLATSMNFTVSAIPEPATGAMWAGVGALGWVIAKRKRRKVA
jgi:hypothetical protein